MARSHSETYRSAIEKIALDRDLSFALKDSANENTRNISWRINRCADDINIWFILDIEHGWLHGRFWKCNHKLCSFCLSAEARRRRRQLLDAIERLETRKRKWHFITFTIENPSASIMTTREIVNAAWKKFRDRSVFAEVRACAKSEEFTVTKLGFHYHVHTLIDSPATYKHPKFKTLTSDGIAMKKAWTESVERSGGESRNLFGFETYDQYLIVDFRPVRQPKDVVNELGKYITKSTSFHDLSRSVINELAEVKRWHRMFELLGDLRNKPPREESGTVRASSVHTKSLIAGSERDLWWFERRREDTRYFMSDYLSTRYDSPVLDIHEMRRKLQPPYATSNE